MALLRFYYILNIITLEMLQDLMGKTFHVQNNKVYLPQKHNYAKVCGSPYTFPGAVTAKFESNGYFIFSSED